MLQPKVFSKRGRLWLAIFEIGEIDHHERLRFPVKDGEIDITETEKLLKKVKLTAQLGINLGSEVGPGNKGERKVKLLTLFFLPRV